MYFVVVAYTHGVSVFNFICLLFILPPTQVGLAVGDVDSRLKTAFENRIELQVSSVQE